MNKPWHVHYLNKYPGGDVQIDENVIVVRCAGGHKRVQLEKNGAGQWLDVSAERACLDRHCLSPIPKESRAFKLYPNGEIRHAEEYSERIGKGILLAKHVAGGMGKVPSLEELKAWEQKVKEEREKAALAPQPAQVEHKPAIPVDFQHVVESALESLEQVPIHAAGMPGWDGG